MGLIERIEWWRIRRADRRRLLDAQRAELAAAARRAASSPRCGQAHPELRGVACQEPLGHGGVLHVDRSGGRAIAWQQTGYER